MRWYGFLVCWIGLGFSSLAWGQEQEGVCAIRVNKPLDSEELGQALKGCEDLEFYCPRCTTFKDKFCESVKNHAGNENWIIADWQCSTGQNLCPNECRPVLTRNLDRWRKHIQPELESYKAESTSAEVVFALFGSKEGYSKQPSRYPEQYHMGWGYGTPRVPRPSSMMKVDNCTHLINYAQEIAKRQPEGLSEAPIRDLFDMISDHKRALINVIHKNWILSADQEPFLGDKSSTSTGILQSEFKEECSWWSSPWDRSFSQYCKGLQINREWIKKERTELLEPAYRNAEACQSQLKQ